MISEESSKIAVPKYLDSKQGEMFRTLVKTSRLKENFDSQEWNKWFNEYDAEERFP